MACGAGTYGAALIATLLVMIMLWPLRYVGRLLDREHVHRLDVDLTPVAARASSSRPQSSSAHG
jgi:uncharacterized membrane protein YhiD involved in acid resistance